MGEKAQESCALADVEEGFAGDGTWKVLLTRSGGHRLQKAGRAADDALPRRMEVECLWREEECQETGDITGEGSPLLRASLGPLQG